MDPHFDIEQPPPSDPPPAPTSDPTSHIRRLTDPAVISAVSEVAQARSVLKIFGPRPDHETVDKAKSKIAEIEADLSRRLEEIVLSPRPPEIERLEWRAHLAGKEKEVREAAERERQMYQAVVSVDEMHGAYERLVREAEAKLERIYEAGEDVVADEGDEEVVGVLREAVGKGIERVDLSGRRLRLIPEAFGRIRGLVLLNLSSNQLEVLNNGGGFCYRNGGGIMVSEYNANGVTVMEIGAANFFHLCKNFLLDFFSVMDRYDAATADM